MDSKDEMILTELKKNARNSTKNIALHLGIPRVTVHDRIQKMMHHGIITSFTARIDYKKLGYATEVYIFISFLPTPGVSQRELARHITKLPGVSEVYIISGEYDLLLKVRGRTLEDIGRLVVEKIRQMKGVSRTLTFSIFETVKEEI